MGVAGVVVRPTAEVPDAGMWLVPLEVTDRLSEEPDPADPGELLLLDVPDEWDSFSSDAELAEDNLYHGWVG